MTAWSHLPNAQLIDQVLSHVALNPQHFSAAEKMPCDWEWLEAAYAVHRTDRSKAWLAAWDAAYCTEISGAPRVTRHTATSAILALVAYDDAGQYLDMTSDQLKLWVALTESPGAILLQPYVRARERVAQTQQICS